MLLLILVLLAIALVVWLAYRSATRGAESALVDRYRVLETTGEGQAHVFVSRGAPDSAVLIGSVGLVEQDFDERYGALVAQAEDRVATLNASRELHADS